MGIRPVVSVVFGVKLTKQEITQMNQASTRQQILYKWIMTMVQYDIAQTRIPVDKRDIWEQEYPKAHLFLKRKPDGSCAKPLRPFWVGGSVRSQVTKQTGKYPKPYYPSLASFPWKDYVHKDIASATEEYLAGMTDKVRDRYNLKWQSSFVWTPDPEDTEDYKPILGCVADEDYYNNIWYSMFPLLKASNSSCCKIFKVPGRLPWELGTTKIKNQWFTMNGEHFIPTGNQVGIKAKTEIRKAIGMHDTREQAIAAKKKVWDKYHGSFPAYRTYPHDCWYDAYGCFYEVDLLYRIVCDMCGLTYDPLRLDKYVVCWWR